MDVELRDNQAEHRFEGLVDGAVAGYVRYHRRPSDGAVVLIHTEVDPAYEGEGVGSALARATLDQLRADGSKIVPLCPFIAGYVKRHSEYAELVTT
ncbi:MAG: GCN5-related N-acetyltransferase [Acidimicrobiales bacterium]|nr:GCN5-related N-acetyltransferase [Acidimicrobiales bacterium]